jgi:hypothetical protein
MGAVANDAQTWDEWLLWIVGSVVGMVVAVIAG